MTTRTDQRRIATAFASLRKAGYTARMNFKCCQSCALSALPDGTTAYVLYHRQGATALDMDGTLTSSLWLYWGNASDDATPIVEALVAAGLDAKWNGSPNSGVEVCP